MRRVAIADKRQFMSPIKYKNKVKKNFLVRLMPRLIPSLIPRLIPWVAVVFIAILLQFFYDPSVLGASLSLAIGLWLLHDMMDKNFVAQNLQKKLSRQAKTVLRWSLIIIPIALVIFSIIYDTTQLDDGTWKAQVRDIFAGYRQPLNLKYHGHFLFVAIWLIALSQFKKKNRVLAIFLLALSFGFVSIYQSVFDYLQNTGDEALLEMKNVNIGEAISFISTLGHNVSFQFNLITVLTAIIFAHIIFSCKNYITDYYARKKILKKKIITGFYCFLMALLITMPLHRLYARSVTAFINNLNFFQQVKEKYKNPLPPIALPRVGLQLVIYIGESTSPLHWSLYGYQRPTTPQLEKLRSDGNLLVFNNVFSTFTHTAPSLLNSLSFRPLSESLFLPVESQKRIPLPAVLASGKIVNHYISTQTESTAYELLGLTIFSNMPKILNNSLHDHQVLLPQLAKIVPSFKNNRSQVVWLHAYAGHAPYLNSLPLNFSGAVDDFYKNQPLNNIISQDGRKSLLREIENYDSAMTYIDSNIGGAIKQIANLPQPVVLVYFSDHGESPAYGLGHDASRFRHEMFRVPFLIYFNQAARQAYPQLFAKYQYLAAASTTRISLLNQFPYTVIDLLGGDIRQFSKTIAIKPVMGEKNSIIEPIMVRGTADGIKYVNLNLNPIAGAPAGTTDVTNASNETKIFLQNFYGKRTCHDVADIRSAVIGSFIAPCLLVDKTMATTNPTLLAAIKTIAIKRGKVIEIKK